MMRRQQPWHNPRRDAFAGAANRGPGPGLAGPPARQDLPPGIWMAAALAVSLVLAAAVLGVMGTDAKALVAALRLTARWSFLLFWMAYAAGPLAVLFGPTFRPLARRARGFGLAYAAAQLVHLGLIVWLFRISPQPPVTGGTFLFFVVAMGWTYGLALLSFRPWSGMLGPRPMHLLRLVGMNYILLAFADDFVHAVIAHGSLFGSPAYEIAYLPFLAMLVLAPLLRLAAGVRKRLPDLVMRRAAPGTPG